MKSMKQMLAVAFVLGTVFVAYSLFGRSSYSIGSEFCWVDPDLQNTKRVGISLKVIDKKTDVIEFSLTHVMATDLMQSMTAKYSELSDSVSEERLKGIIEKNTLTKSACGELYSQKQKLTQLIEVEMKKQAALDAEAKAKKDAEEKETKAKLAIEMDEAKKLLEKPDEVFCVFDKADQYGKSVEYFVTKYIGSHEHTDKTLYYEFAQGRYDSEAHKILPEDKSTMWELSEFVSALPRNLVITGKDRCISEIEKRHAEKVKLFEALNIKINQIVCTPYSTYKVIGFENSYEGQTSIGRRRVILLPVELSDKGRAIASEYGSKNWADRDTIVDQKNQYNLNESECLAKMQEESGDVNDRISGCDIAALQAKKKIAQQIAELISNKIAADKQGRLAIDPNESNDPGLKRAYEEQLAGKSIAFLSGVREHGTYWEHRDYSKSNGNKRVFTCATVVAVSDKDYQAALLRSSQKAQDIVEDADAKAAVKSALQDVDKDFAAYQPKSN